MAPVRRGNTNNKKLLLKQLISQGRRAPKNFTFRRQRTAAEFMDKWAENPQNYPKFGTTDWTKSFAKHINHGTRCPVSHMDVEFWLKTNKAFFGQLQWEKPLRRQSQMPTETTEQPEREPFEEFVKKLPNSAEFLAAKIKSEAKAKEELKDEPITENSPDTEGDELEESLQLTEVLPPEPSSGYLVTHMIGQLKDYSAMLSEQIQELRICGCVPQTMENCLYTVNILNIFLAEGDVNMLEALPE